MASPSFSYSMWFLLLPGYKQLHPAVYLISLNLLSKSGGTEGVTEEFSKEQNYSSNLKIARHIKP